METIGSVKAQYGRGVHTELTPGGDHKAGGLLGSLKSSMGGILDKMGPGSIQKMAGGVAINALTQMIGKKLGGHAG